MLCGDFRRDIYFYNDDGRTTQFRVGRTSTVPRIVNKTSSNDYRFVVDYHNKRFIFVRNGAPSTLWITPTLDYKNAISIGNVVGDGVFGIVPVWAIACDYVNRRIFYGTYQVLDPTLPQIRVVNYDGTGDVQVVNEPSIADPPFSNAIVDVRQLFLNYNHANDRIYYMRSYSLHAGSHTEIRSVHSDGSGLQTECTTSNLVFFQSYLADPLGTVLTLYFSGSTFYLAQIGLVTGGLSTILSSTNNGVDPFYTFVAPQYCYKDGKIYFCRWGRNFGTDPDSYHTTYERINPDGSGNEVLFSFYDPVPPHSTDTFGWQRSQNSPFRIGGGFEFTGNDYSGVG